MKQKKKRVFSRSGFLLLICTAAVGILLSSCSPGTVPEGSVEESPQYSIEDLTAQLNAIILPIAGSSPQLDHSDLHVLDYLKDVKIVGLGEATHGTKEFFEMKHRIFKYLVEEHGYRAFAFECDFAESLYFDRYITTGEGDLETLMKTKMYFWTWRNEEVKRLLEWMRSYNEGLPEDLMIHYYGVDCQHMDYYPGMLTEYLEKVSPEIVETVIPMFVDINDISDENLQWILDRFEENEAGFTALSSPGEYQIAKHMVRVMMQVNVVRGGRTDPLRYRDRFMAENTLWVADFMGEGAKIALWAHNGHVSNDGSFRSMGRDLKKELEDNYQMIGFSFSIGSFTARKANGIWDPQECVIDTVLSGSTNYIFHNAQYENFILKMADIPAGSSLSEWMRDLHSFLMVGATYDGDLEGYYNDYNLSICYDVIIHFDETEASHLIPL